MNGFEAMAALEKGQKVRDVEWPEKHYWQCVRKGVKIQIVGTSPEKITYPAYGVNDLFGRVWEIYKEYVTFEEAMKAFKEGATVRAWENDGFYEINEAMSFKDLYEHYPAVGLGNLSLMKWTIEDEGENK
jgi:hypothetical protein